MPLDTGEALETEVAPSLAGLEALRGEWERLWARAPDATPFQAPACLLPWARHYAPDRTAAVLVREAGRLIGLLPVFSWEGALLLAGTGPTDYNDGIFEPERADAARLALARACEVAADRGCERIELRQLRARSLLLNAPEPAGWSAERGGDYVCPIAPVHGPDGLSAMPHKWAKKLAYTRRKIARAGGYTVELATPATVDNLRGALERLHAERWRAVGEPGVLADDPLMRAFLAEMLPEALRSGLLRLRALRIEGEIAAVVCALQGHGAVHMYLAGLDPERMPLGPGTLLIAETIQAAAAEGAREVHFLRGEEPYKANWGAVPAQTFRRTLRPA